MVEPNEKAKALKSAIVGLEAQRSVLGEAIVEPALAALRQQLSELERPVFDRGGQGERKIVTVVFADISGFTAMAEKADPEEVRRVINACFECLVPIVRKYEGTIDKFIGDEIMALFGAPVAHEDDSERALRTAWEMMEAIADFNRKHGAQLSLHVGVNTGHVIAGAVGAEGRQDYSVMGDAVNLAARLGEASSAGEILVGPNTHRQTATIFDFDELPPFSLKGKEQPVQIRRLVGVKTAPKRRRGIEGLRARLVGREHHLSQLRSALTELRNGRGSTLAVVGEAGLGKSRLVAEALDAFAGGLRTAEGRAFSYTSGMSYWMAGDVLRALLQDRAVALSASIESTLGRSIAEAMPQRVADVYPYLGRLLDLPLPGAMGEQVKLLTSEALQRRILQAFQNYVRARAMLEPLVLFWEDLHWCDPSSLRVLEQLLPVTRETSLLLLLAYRADQELVRKFETGVRSVDGENLRVIELSPLTREEGACLIQDLLKIDNLKERTRALILDRAEGNPFFIEELLRSLLDSGALAIEDGRVRATRAIESLDVPETIHGVLMARIDRLSPEEKQALQNAAVIGRVFRQKVLAYIHDENANAPRCLDDSLDELERRDFIRSRNRKGLPGEREYSFKHAITHDVAYNSLLIARRKELHKRAAEAIEALFRNQLDELSATLGYHFQKAEAREKAIYYLRQAAQRSQATFANSEAIAFYLSALEQVDLLLSAGVGEPWSRTAAELQENIGDIQQLIGKTEEARASFDGAQRRVPANDVLWSSRLHRKAAKTWVIDRGYDNAGHVYKEAEVVLQSRASSSKEWQQEWLQIQLDRMWLDYWRGRVEEIKVLAERIRPLVNEHASELQRGNFFQGLTLMALRRDRYTADDKTITDAEASLDAIERSKVLLEIGHARFVLGFTYLWADKRNVAEKWLDNALQLSKRTGDIVLQSRCLTYLTMIHRRNGNVEAARDYALQSSATATAGRMAEYIGMAKGNLAWVHLRQNDPARAYDESLGAIEKMRGTTQSTIFQWVPLWPLTAVLLTLNQTGEAIKHLGEMLGPSQMALPADLEREMRSAIRAWQANDPDVAKGSLARAANRAKELGFL